MMRIEAGRAHTARRQFLLAAAGALAASGIAPKSSARQRVDTPRKRTFVLVHGAWHGGWCWDLVRTMLEAAGHRVFTPTLAGLGERADELTADVGLDTHIHDVMHVVDDNDLDDIVLCGHSYGGMVITAVADRAKARIAHAVYLDAALPRDGESMLSYGQPRPQAAIDAATAAMIAMAADGIGIATFPPEFLGVPKDHPLYSWVADNLTPHPLKTWTDPVALTDGADGGTEDLARTYVHCTAPVLAQTQFPWLASQLRDRPDWAYAELATGHDAMVTDPRGVAQILLCAAQPGSEPCTMPNTKKAS